MKKKPISKTEEKKATIRNGLTLPLTVLELISEGKKVTKKDALLALKELQMVVKNL